MSLDDARNLVDESVGLQGNMDPRIFYQENIEIENYLESLSKFGKETMIGSSIWGMVSFLILIILKFKM